MQDSHRPWSIAVAPLLMLGLLCIGVSFSMLDHGWLYTPPIAGINHPIAAAVGAVGILLCLASIALRRLGRRRQ